MLRKFKRLLLVPLLLLSACQKGQENELRELQGPNSEKAALTGAAPDPNSLQNQAAACMGQFDFNRAVGLYEKLVLMKTESLEAKIDLAIALLNRRLDGDLARSAETLDEVLLQDPSDLRAEYCRALLYFNEGKSGLAQALFEQVAKADPQDGYAIYYIGQCQLMQGEFKQAFSHFLLSQRVDPYLRSAYYGAFQAAQRLKNTTEVRSNLETFQKLADNLRSRVAELKYTRMGPKAEVDRPVADTSPLPASEGPLFGDSRPLLDGQVASHKMRVSFPETVANLTFADMNGDGKTDLFLAGVASEESTQNTVLLNTNNTYRQDSACPLARVSQVNAALWGDFDNDGLVDVYFCRQGPNQLWRQSSPGRWTYATETTFTAAGEGNTVDGMCYDADHDGDLDYFLVQAEGPCELLSNNLDGTFRSLAEEVGLTNVRSGAKQAVVADLDRDQDADILIVYDTPPHAVLLNDRLWQYHPAEHFEKFCASVIAEAVAADTNADGQVELYTLSDQELTCWQVSESGEWLPKKILQVDEQPAKLPRALTVADFDGDTESEILFQIGNKIRVVSADGAERATVQHAGLAAPIAIRVGLHGPELVGFASDLGPVLWPAGTGRYPFCLVSLSGKEDKAVEMRSNASGIGVTGAARCGERWSPVSTWRTDAGPGQSLQPLAIGTGSRGRLDFIELEWPDGVSQTETDLPAGKFHAISETQRQSGSCPLVFVWNGERYEFVADILGGGGIGFNLGKGEYFDPRPSENLSIPADRLRAKDEHFIIKLGEPMEEICYFDAVRLVAYDLPPGWEMALDERFGGTDPQPTGEPIFFTSDSEMIPIKAVNEHGEDATDSLLSADQIAAPLRRADKRFAGYTNPCSMTLTFPSALDDYANPVLVFDGWVEYAYSQTAFAAWQAGIIGSEPTIEARGETGEWKVVLDRFGYMAGTSRRSAVRLPLEKLPRGTKQLRISTNMQIYWDRFAVIDSRVPDQFERQELTMDKAKVAEVGFSARRLGDQRLTSYDYQCRPPLGDTRHPTGSYTAFGDARELVARTDDVFAIIGPGEELHLEFAASLSDCAESWTRYFVLEADGWCKDADLFTKGAGSVEPLPKRFKNLDTTQIRRREELSGKYNTRHRSGR